MSNPKKHWLFICLDLFDYLRSKSLSLCCSAAVSRQWRLHILDAHLQQRAGERGVSIIATHGCQICTHNLGTCSIHDHRRKTGKWWERGGKIAANVLLPILFVLSCAVSCCWCCCWHRNAMGREVDAEDTKRRQKEIVWIVLRDLIFTH